MSWNLLRNKGKYHRCCCVAVDYFPIWLYGHLLNENLQTIRPTLYLLYTTFSPYKTLDWQAPMPLNTTILLTEIQRPILPPLNSKVASAPLMVSYSQIRCISLRVLQTLKEFWVFCSVNHLRGPRSTLFVSVFQGFAHCDRPVSYYFGQWSTSFRRSFLWSFLLLSLTRIKQCLPPSFNKNSTHHRVFLRYSWAV